MSIGDRIRMSFNEIVDEWLLQIQKNMEQAKENREKILQEHQRVVEELEQQWINNLKGLDVEDSRERGEPSDPEMVHSKKPQLEQRREEIDHLMPQNRIAREQTNVIAAVEQDVRDLIHQSSPTLEKDGLAYEFKAIQEDKMVYHNRENNQQMTVDPSEADLSLEMRGRLAAIQYLKSMSEDEIAKNVREVRREAARSQRPFEEVYREKMKDKIEKRIQVTRSVVLNKARGVQKKLDKSKREIRQKIRVINNEIGTLKKEQQLRRNPEKDYSLEIDKLVEKREKLIENRESIESQEKNLNDELKRDLKAQFPGMSLKGMKLEDTLSAAIAAQAVVDKGMKGIEGLKQYAKEHEMDGLSKSLKDTEIEITEIQNPEFEFER